MMKNWDVGKEEQTTKRVEKKQEKPNAEVLPSEIDAIKDYTTSDFKAATSEQFPCSLQ